MRRFAFFVFLALSSAATLALYPGTRSLTDVKGPAFAAAVFLTALLILTDSLSVRSFSRPAGLDAFLYVALAYLAFTALSAAWSMHPWIVKYVFAERALAVVVTLVAAVLAAEARRWKVLGGWYVALGATVAAASLAYHGLFPHFALHEGTTGEALLALLRSGLRANTLNDVRFPLGNANLLAAFLLFPAAFSMAFFVNEWREKRRKTVLGALVLSLVLVMAVFVLCRAVSYWIGLGVMVIIFTAVRIRRRGALLAVLVAAGLVLSVVGWKVGAVERFKRSKSYIVRAELWRRAVLMTRDKPLLGWGAGSFLTDGGYQAATGALRKVQFVEGGRTHERRLHEVMPSGDSNVHNEYFQHTAEGGIVALGLYIALLAAVAAPAVAARRSGRTKSPLIDAALALFAAFLVTNIFNPEVHFADFGPHFWILGGMLIAAGGRESTARYQRLRGAVPVVLVGALVIAGGCYVAATDYAASRRYYQAQRAAASRDYSRAGMLFDRAAAGTWDGVLKARALYSGSTAHARAGRVDLERKDLELLAGHYLSLADTDYRLGMLLERSGDVEGAVAAYIRHTALHPEDTRSAERIIFLKGRKGPEADGPLQP